MTRHTVLGVLALLATACAVDNRAEPDSEAKPVLAAYVLLVSGPSGARPLARAIVDGSAAACPTLTTAGGQQVAMLARSNPHGFGVTVCEQYMSFGEVNTVSGWTTPLPVASDSPTHPLIVGDTGCKHHTCGTGEAEPFATLATEAAQRDPDLVLHVGDFNYRGTGGFSYQGSPEYDAGDTSDTDPTQCQLESPYVSQNASYGGKRKDSWESWNADLFAPGAPLFAAAPWIVTRGNHELCSRAGPGWFYFLDPSTALDGGTQQSCPTQEDYGGKVPTSAHGHILLSEPQMVVLKTLQVAVLDSANACDQYAPATTTKQYTAQFNALLASVPVSPPTWILTHRPIWGVHHNVSTAMTLETALSAANPLPAGLSLIVSGHMHLFQSITFAPGGRPPQLVVGNSGVSLETPKPDGSFNQKVDGQEATGLAFSHHGFLDVTSYDPTTGAWCGAVIDKHNDTIATCNSDAPGGSICSRGTAKCP